ncbi:FKBP-type peptidyl-prolyl cis-trans isomerase N-terminal domain-containing protein [Erwinia aphidicola]|uniref:FKBP-type peptidyl-prolyl cis-trans isomerase N-terminal domain-containing protein n=1 Tax=Erwinia aphidicola TaxID=68334 RepID=UPI0020A10FC7|nr:FKBP-type peptidyl-prolyl cis-trans isomerase N-terminal domain-containing protein [Erwinia aphidicola]MCP2231176.1 FKBP-type peptidyl-prolyl cis-trans isomerase/predicted nucleic acid-binding Zn-ribbon protein [Erwinia aphidicola]
MIGKRFVPFAFSRIALLICCLTAASQYACAAEGEAPAILQFARKYQQQQQQLNPPVYPPRNKPRVVEHVAKKRAEQVTLPVDNLKLKQLQQELKLKDQQLSAKSSTINQLQQSRAELQKTIEAGQKKLAQQAASQALLSLKNAASLLPTPETLAEKLRQANQQLNVARQSESSLQSKLKLLNLELVELRSKVRSQAATADRQRESGQKNDAMAQQIDALTQSQTHSKIDLAQSRQQVDQARAQQQKIEQQMKMLSAKMEAERQKFAAEKQQLLEQVSAGPNSGEQLAASQLQVKSLQAQLDSLKLTSTKSSDARIAALTADKQASDEKAKELQTKLDAALANKPVAMVTNPLEVTKEQLKQKASREAYAIGMSLGAEILQMQAENAINDLPKDQHIVLGGIIDAFQNQAKLSSDVLRTTLTELNGRLKKQRDKIHNNLDMATKSYLAKFTKRKGTIKSAAGFWYNIDYPGDSAIPKNATLDVVVKESLTNGTVITDMDASGTMLTQPVSAFPPVFREALIKLRNHGSAILVVPPELAYGSKGYPPKIPPNATMVYQLRISDIYPENQKKNEVKNGNG